MSRSILKWLTRMLAVDAAIAVAAPLFQSLLDPNVTWQRLMRQYLFSVIYSNLIGFPLGIVLPTVWIRTARMPMLTKSAIRGGLVLAANVAGCLVAGLIVGTLTGWVEPYWFSFRYSLGLSLTLSSVVVAFISMYETQEGKLRHSTLQLKNKELERERTLKLATEAKLSSLEARIHPHFLFNTLNSVSSLIHEDPLRAERMLTRFAELLRFSLDAAAGGLVLLEREMQIVESYLEIEKARFGSRLTYEIDVPRDFESVRVPPLSLQTLVENSVKFAVGPRGRGASVAVRAELRAGWVRLAVEDDGPGFEKAQLLAGHGLHNLSERLAVLFGEAARLDIQSAPGRTTVAIEIASGAAGMPEITVTEAATKQ